MSGSVHFPLPWSPATGWSAFCRSRAAKALSVSTMHRSCKKSSSSVSSLLTAMGVLIKHLESLIAPSHKLPSIYWMLGWEQRDFCWKFGIYFLSGNLYICPIRLAVKCFLLCDCFALPVSNIQMDSKLNSMVLLYLWSLMQSLIFTSILAA